MSEIRIKWDEGDGYITTTEKGTGDAEVPFSSIANEGIDRTNVVSVTTKEGVTRSIKVNQIGLRETFNTSDVGEFVCSDGSTFNVLKDGVQQ